MRRTDGSTEQVVLTTGDGSWVADAAVGRDAERASVHTYSVSEQRLLELLDGLALPRLGPIDPAFAGLLNALNRRGNRSPAPAGSGGWTR